MMCKKNKLGLAFGDRVIVSHKYIRQMDGWSKKYVAMPFIASGIFLGLRTIQNGSTDCSDDEGYSWEASEYIRVALVATNPNTNPVYVPIGSIETIENSNW